MRKLSTLVTSTLLFTMLAYPEVVKAQRSSESCSNETVRGQYVIQLSGFLNTNSPLASTVLITFDGNGNLSGTILARSLGGNVTTNLPTRGVYRVTEDCVITSSTIRDDGSSANYTGVVINEGNKFYQTQADSDSTVNVVAERVKPQRSQYRR